MSTDPTLTADASAEVPANTATPARGWRAVWNGWPGRVGRLALAVLPLLWLSRKVHWGLVADRAVAVGFMGLALALLANLASLAVGALRWQVMLRAYGADRSKLPSVLTLFRHNVVGSYFSVLPTGMAGEAVRGYRVAHCLPNAGTSYLLLFVERIAGLLGLLAIAAAAAVFSPALRGGPVAFAMNLGVAAALGCGAIAFVLPQLATRFPVVRTWMQRVPVAGSILARIPAAQNLGGPLLAVLLSIATQGFVVLSVAALILPLSPAATLGLCARVVPAIVLVTYIPLTPGGLGQREVAFTQFFGMAHVEREAALAASLLYFAITLVTAVIGGLVLLYERVRGL